MMTEITAHLISFQEITSPGLILKDNEKDDPQLVNNEKKSKNVIVTDTDGM